MNYMMCRVEERVQKEKSVKEKSHQRGANRHESHRAVFKAKVIHECQGNVSQYHVADKYCINQSLVSKWVKEKDIIISNAMKANKKLLSKQRASRKYNQLYDTLLTRFKKARAKGHQVYFNWLWSRARVIYREQQGNEEAVVKKLRCRQHNKKLPKEEYRNDLAKWHGLTRERLIRTGLKDSYTKNEDDSYRISALTLINHPYHSWLT